MQFSWNAIPSIPGGVHAALVQSTAGVNNITKEWIKPPHRRRKHFNLCLSVPYKKEMVIFLIWKRGKKKNLYKPIFCKLYLCFCLPMYVYPSIYVSMYNNRVHKVCTRIYAYTNPLICNRISFGIADGLLIQQLSRHWLNSRAVNFGWIFAFSPPD